MPPAGIGATQSARAARAAWRRQQGAAVISNEREPAVTDGVLSNCTMSPAAKARLLRATLTHHAGEPGARGPMTRTVWERLTEDQRLDADANALGWFLIACFERDVDIWWDAEQQRIALSLEALSRLSQREQRVLHNLLEAYTELKLEQDADGRGGQTT